MKTNNRPQTNFIFLFLLILIFVCSAYAGEWDMKIRVCTDRTAAPTECSDNPTAFTRILGTINIQKVSFEVKVKNNSSKENYYLGLTVFQHWENEMPTYNKIYKNYEQKIGPSGEESLYAPIYCNEFYDGTVIISLWPGESYKGSAECCEMGKESCSWANKYGHCFSGNPLTTRSYRVKCTK